MSTHAPYCRLTDADPLRLGGLVRAGDVAPEPDGDGPARAELEDVGVTGPGDEVLTDSAPVTRDRTRTRASAVTPATSTSFEPHKTRFVRTNVPTLDMDLSRLLNPDADPEGHAAEWRRVYQFFDPYLRFYFEDVLRYADTDDLVATVWCKAFLKISLFTTMRHEPFFWWLVRIGVNARRTEIRDDGRRAVRETAAVDAAVHDEEPHWGDAILERLSADPAFAGRINRAQFDAAMAALPKLSREVAVLHLVEELSHQEIAERLSLPNAAASRQRLRWVKRQVRAACGLAEAD